jgi:hypothetical protein
MAKVEFNYGGIITIILCSETDKMEDICQKFANKLSLNLNNICFLYNGKQMDIHLTYEQIINKLDKNRKTMSILVNELISDDINDESNKIKLIYPICIKCKQNIILDINDFKIILSQCRNEHKNKILINEYEKNQIIDIKKIKCDECIINNKFNTYNNEMYICNNCDKILCPLCKNNHDKKHNIINYDLKNYICKIHSENYISYCNKCKINLCLKCQKEHKLHETILYSNIMPDKDDLTNKLNNFRNILNKFNKNIEKIINKLKNIKDNMEILYNIYYEMINKYEDKYRNYEILMSLK